MITNATLLRTMTRLSVMQEGKYAGVQIQKILDLGHTRYLRHVYYSLSMLSFTPDILEEIRIFNKYRIIKPGIDLDIMKIVDEEVMKKTSVIQRLKTKSHSKRVNKAIAISNEISDFKYQKKEYLQRKNHGHKMSI